MGDSRMSAIQLKTLQDTIFNSMGKLKIHSHSFILLYRSPVCILSGRPLFRTCIRLVWFYRNSVSRVSNTFRFSC